MNLRNYAVQSYYDYATETFYCALLYSYSMKKERNVNVPNHISTVPVLNFDCTSGELQPYGERTLTEP